MTDAEKRMVSGLRERGLGYIRIAKAVGISPNTVKSFCKRHDIREKNGVCLYCGKTLKQKESGRGRKKKFCNIACRQAWWSTHLELLHHRKTKELVCPNCHKVFTATGSRERKYCCHQCYVEARFGKHED